MNIEEGVYIEEPVRTRVGLPVIPDGGFIFDGKNVWRKQNRQPTDYIEYEAIRGHGTSYAKFRYNWCGSTHMTQLNRETVSPSCPNCGGPR